MSNKRRLHKRELRQAREQERQQAAAGTFWNGEPTPCTRGTAIIADDGRFPDYWARGEGVIGLRMPVVRVDYGEHTSYLYDVDGEGWAKVTEGHGGPRWPHRNVAIEPGSWRFR